MGFSIYSFQKSVRIRHFAYVVVLCLSLCGMTSCEVETSGNGELDGFWHLERIDSLQNGGSKDLTFTSHPISYFVHTSHKKVLLDSYKKMILVPIFVIFLLLL